MYVTAIQYTDASSMLRAAAATRARLWKPGSVALYKPNARIMRPDNWDFGFDQHVMCYRDHVAINSYAQATMEIGENRPESPAVPVTIKRVIEKVSIWYNVTISEIKSNRRTRAIVLPRQVAMYLAKMMTPRSLPQIGSRFGRDHTTVLFAIRKVTALMANDAKLRSDIEGIRQSILGRCAR